MALIKCVECGKEISTSAVSCPNCGAKNKNNERELTGAPAGLKVICFLFTIVGIIIYAMNISTNPKYAKDCLMCSLMPFILVFAIIIISGIMGVLSYLIL